MKIPLMGPKSTEESYQKVANNVKKLIESFVTVVNGLDSNVTILEEIRTESMNKVDELRTKIMKEETTQNLVTNQIKRVAKISGNISKLLAE